MPKPKCSWCTKELSRKPEFYKGRFIHKECKAAWIKWEKNVCASCKINFSKLSPEYKKSKMHKGCYELIQRGKNSVEKPFRGGTGSKK